MIIDKVHLQLSHNWNRKYAKTEQVETKGTKVGQTTQETVAYDVRCIIIILYVI